MNYMSATWYGDCCTKLRSRVDTYVLVKYQICLNMSRANKRKK